MLAEDRVLIWKSKRGDQRAFDRIYHKHLDTMLSVAVSLLGDRSEAEDVVQDVFVKLIETLDQFQLRGSLKAFLATCVANRARDQLRRKMRKDRTGPALQENHGRATEPLERAMFSEDVLRVHSAMSQLPYEQKEVVTLKIHGGLSFRALAQQLELPLGTVQGRYRYGLDRLRSLLNGEVEK
ncbi:MAG: sigma-70 family RNA polymerase sigma factor [Planctomycetes bacterium]|nr:sigma-70 family RNA polymerase sigma factor [Planctomycetota bacterium]